MTDDKWNFSQEREYIETLLNTRFNFFLLFFSLVITSAVSARTQLHLQLVLTVGVAITFMLLPVLLHTQEKVTRTIDTLRKEEPNHPAMIVDAACSTTTARTFIGKWIPLTCVATLFSGAMLAWVGYLRV